MSKQRISLIVARAAGGVIGRGGTMPWHAPADLRYFKDVTLGKPVIMGRKTFESLGGKPLAGRQNIVVSRQLPCGDGYTVARSLPDALALVSEAEEVMIIGGSEVYKAAMSLAHRIYVTELDLNIEGGDTFFDTPAAREWERVREEVREVDAANPAMRFCVYERKKS